MDSYNCKQCKDEGWDVDNISQILIYKTETIANIKFRYKRCLNCGYKFITKELFEREIRSSQQNLFDENGDK